MSVFENVHKGILDTKYSRSDLSLLTKNNAKRFISMFPDGLSYIDISINRIVLKYSFPGSNDIKVGFNDEYNVICDLEENRGDNLISACASFKTLHDIEKEYSHRLNLKKDTAHQDINKKVYDVFIDDKHIDYSVYKEITNGLFANEKQESSSLGKYAAVFIDHECRNQFEAEYLLWERKVLEVYPDRADQKSKSELKASNIMGSLLFEKRYDLLYDLLNILSNNGGFVHLKFIDPLVVMINERWNWISKRWYDSGVSFDVMKNIKITFISYVYNSASTELKNLFISEHCSNFDFFSELYKELESMRDLNDRDDSIRSLKDIFEKDVALIDLKNILNKILRHNMSNNVSENFKIPTRSKLRFQRKSVLSDFISVLSNESLEQINHIYLDNGLGVDDKCKGRYDLSNLDSKNSPGIRCADMIVGLIGYLMKNSNRTFNVLNESQHFIKYSEKDAIDRFRKGFSLIENKNDNYSKQASLFYMVNFWIYESVYMEKYYQENNQLLLSLQEFACLLGHIQYTIILYDEMAKKPNNIYTYDGIFSEITDKMTRLYELLGVHRYDTDTRQRFNMYIHG